MSRVGLATCAEFPDLEEPERTLIPALHSLGIEATPVVWDDPDVGWASFDLVVVRNTWDYVDRRDEFLAWVERTQDTCGIANPPSLIRWNTDKRYLGELVAAGLPVVPTTFLDPSAGDDDAVEQARRMGRHVVVKPAVSAGSQDTGRYDLDHATAQASAHLTRLLRAGRAVMVQPYISSVDVHGETALLYFDGTFSHAIRKGPLLTGQGIPDNNGLFVEEDIAPRTPSDSERALGDRVMAHVAQDAMPLYARIDLLATDDGPVVLEVELTEPSLFLDQDPGAPGRLAATIAGRLQPAG